MSLFLTSLRPALRTSALSLTLAAALAGCAEDGAIAPVEPGRDYYPVEAGTYRIYAAADTAYNRFVRTDSSYQVREAIGRADTFRNAAGQLSFRVEHAVRRTPAQPWRIDSVYVLTPTAETVTLVRNNRRTVELIFPVRDNRAWNLNAYNSLGALPDSTRRYHSVGRALTLAAGGVAQTYGQTLTTLDEGAVAQDNLYYLQQYQQVFAKGVGPVLRRRRDIAYAEPNGSLPVAGKTYYGRIHHEILLEKGLL